MQLPGWGSLESVTRLHSFIEVAGISALAALVLFEVLASSTDTGATTSLSRRKRGLKLRWSRDGSVQGNSCG